MSPEQVPIEKTRSFAVQGKNPFWKADQEVMSALLTASDEDEYSMCGSFYGSSNGSHSPEATSSTPGDEHSPVTSAYEGDEDDYDPLKWIVPYEEDDLSEIERLVDSEILDTSHGDPAECRCEYGCMTKLILEWDVPQNDNDFSETQKLIDSEILDTSHGDPAECCCEYECRGKLLVLWIAPERDDNGTFLVYDWDPPESSYEDDLPESLPFDDSEILGNSHGNPYECFCPYGCQDKVEELEALKSNAL